MATPEKKTTRKTVKKVIQQEGQGFDSRAFCRRAAHSGCAGSHGGHA